MGFTFSKLEIPDIILIKSDVFGDERGFFSELYKQSDFMKAGIKEKFAQDSYSRSQKGTLRGLHFQRAPMEQGKLVRVTSGRIFDVAVDIRNGSPTYGRHVSRTLSADGSMLFIPAGFAHGFASLEDKTEVMYKTTNEYSKEHEGGILWNDPALAISWPLADPTVSDRDKRWPTLAEYAKKPTK